MSMSREEALVLIRSGKTGNQILDILEKISSFSVDVEQDEVEVSDVEFVA
jgi:hypothetical protein